MKTSATVVAAVALKMLMGLGIAVLLCGRANAQGAGKTEAPASAQGLVTQRDLSLAMAKTVAEAAMAACEAKGYHTAVAVVDRAGQVLVILRDEQAGADCRDGAAQGVHGADVSHHHRRFSSAPPIRSTPRNGIFPISWRWEAALRFR